MRKLILTTAIASLFLLGCSKDSDQSQLVEPNSGLSNFNNADILITMPTSTRPIITLEDLGIDINDSRAEKVTITRKAGGNTHLSGHFSHQTLPAPAFYPDQTISFSGTMNSQNTIGKAHWTRTYLDTNGVLQTFTFSMTAQELNVSGTDAVYVGIFSQVTGTPPYELTFGTGPFDLNIGVTKFFFKIKDNGNGPNATDQYHPAVITNPSGTIPNFIFAVDAPVWGFIGIMTDVANSSDNIVVN